MASKDKNLPSKKDPTISERFTSMITREYSNTINDAVTFSPLQRRLSQHLFIKADMALAALEKKRLASQNGNKRTPIVWQNVNTDKLAIDGVHIIELGLDALIPNHVHIIPYFNNRMQKYDIDLRVGYAGKDYYYRRLALDPPKDIIYELVYENDELEVIKKSAENPVESYQFKINSPFDRGDVVGGFGYIVYADAEKNKLELISRAELEAARGYAQSDEFWKKHRIAMMYKTIVHRTVRHIALDPEKINQSFAVTEQNDFEPAAGNAQQQAASQANAFANTGDVIDISGEKQSSKQSSRDDSSQSQPFENEPLTEEEKAEILAEEARQAEAEMAESESDGPGF